MPTPITAQILQFPLSRGVDPKITTASRRVIPAQPPRRTPISIGDEVYSHKHGRRGWVREIDIDNETRCALRFHIEFPTFARTWPVQPGELEKVTGAA